MVVGVLIVWIRQSALESKFLVDNLNKTVWIKAIIRNDPVLRDGQVFGSSKGADKYSVLISLIQVNDRKVNLPARLIFNTDNRLQMDQVIKTQVRLIETRERKVAALALAKDSITILSPPRTLFNITEIIRDKLRSHSDGSIAASLVPGLVLGDTSLQSNQFKNQMQGVGLSHLTAVSGANFVLVASSILWFLQFIIKKNQYRLIIVSLILFLFIFLVRPTPSVLRAAAMTSVVLFARYRGETSRGIASLGAAITFLILIDPFQAIDPGFALSVLATAGILLLSPLLEIKLQKLIKSKLIIEVVSIPVSATILCLPIILLLSNEISIATIPANILVAPVIGPITVLGFLSAILSPVLPTIGFLLFSIATYFAKYIVFISGAMDKFPSLHFNEARVYVLIFIIFALLVLKRRGKIAIVIILVLIVQLVFSERTWPGKNWQVVNCDVGQGDGMVINLGRHSAIVVDTGPDSKLIDDCLAELKITKIPLLILSHFHADHVGGITGVLKNRSVGQVWISNLHQPETAYKESIEALHNIPVKNVSKGETYTFTKNNIEIKILWPNSVIENFSELPGDGSKINNSSIAILLRTKNYSLFSAGDIEPEVQELISKSGLLSDVDILKVSHHGSAYQYLPMIDLLKPEIALISVGAKNSYGHPDLEFINELEKRSISVWRTDLSGGISVAPGNKIRATGKEWWKIRWG